MKPEVIVLAIIAAPGFWELLKALFNKIAEVLFDKKTISNVQIGEKLDGLEKRTGKLEDSFVKLEDGEIQKEVLNARRRILRFNDELLRKQKHSKEYFDDILADIDTYEHYCDNNHESFRNGKATMAIKNIKRCYETCTVERSFLQ